jgi:hypothetical protein
MDEAPCRAASFPYGGGRWGPTLYRGRLRGREAEILQRNSTAVAHARRADCPDHRRRRLSRSTGTARMRVQRDLGEEGDGDGRLVSPRQFGLRLSIVEVGNGLGLLAIITIGPWGTSTRLTGEAVHQSSARRGSASHEDRVTLIKKKVKVSLWSNSISRGSRLFLAVNKLDAYNFNKQMCLGLRGDAMHCDDHLCRSRSKWRSMRRVCMTETAAALNEKKPSLCNWQTWSYPTAILLLLISI